MYLYTVHCASCNLFLVRKYVSLIIVSSETETAVVCSLCLQRATAYTPTDDYRLRYYTTTTTLLLLASSTS